MVCKHRCHNYQITVSSGFWFRCSVSVLVNWISFLRHIFMNSVPGALYFLEPSMVRRSGTTRSVINFFNAITAYDFLAMGFISTNKVPLDKTWPYLFLSKLFFSPTLLYYHIPSNHFFCNILYDWYLHGNGITDNSIICCVIIFSVSFVCSRIICRGLMAYSGDTDECRPLYRNVFDCGTSRNSIPTWDNFLGIDQNLCWQSTSVIGCQCHTGISYLDHCHIFPQN